MQISGWINFNKPKGMSSAKAVAIVKRGFQVKKAGHIGTLDPLASGVLPIAINEATKAIQFIKEDTKVYNFELHFGSQTTTDDDEGEIIHSSANYPTQAEIISILPQFIGEILQTPPIYSAIKLNGRRAYDLARDNIEIELTARPIVIDDIKLIKQLSENVYQIRVTCQKGTYIRSLARDIAIKLGTFGHARNIIREKVGLFSLDMSISLEKFENLVHKDKLRDSVYPIGVVLDDILAIQLDSTQVDRLRKGQSLNASEFDANLAGISLLIAHEQNNIVAVCEVIDEEIKPKRGFNINK